MSHGMKRWVVVVLVVAAAFSVIGTAVAQGPGGRRGGPSAGMGMQPGVGFGVRAQLGAHVLDAVMDATGLSLVEVQSALRDGQTLTEVIEANGGDPQAVKDSVTAAVTAEIDAAVADGTLTETRAAALKEQLPDALDRMLTADRPLFDTPLREAIRLRAEDSLLGVIAELAGVDVADLLRDAAQPITLAQIAEDLGLDANAVIGEAEARITDEINSRVAAGDLTEEQGAALLENLHTHLTDRFNAPLFGGMRGWIGEQGVMGRMMDNFGRPLRGRMMDEFGRGRGMWPGMGLWDETDSDDGTLES